MEIEILRLLDGAKNARGTTVVIDVFRAYTVECTAFARGARRVLPVATIEEAWALKRAEPKALLVGERGGWRCEGFDCNNSPSDLLKHNLMGRTMIHTTSAGTQGVAAARDADELLGGALVNARATAEYIRARNPKRVSLVAMGLAGKEPTDEDELCARYLKALLEGREMDLSNDIAALKETSGRKFFDPALQEPFPRADFDLCTRVDSFEYVLKIDRRIDGGLIVSAVGK